MEWVWGRRTREAVLGKVAIVAAEEEAVGVRLARHVRWNRQRALRHEQRRLPSLAPTCSRPAARRPFAFNAEGLLKNASITQFTVQHC